MSADHTFVDSQGRMVTGRETMITGWSAYFSVFPDFHVTAERMIVEGDTVAIFGQVAGTFHGRRGGLPENRITMPGAWKAIVEDSKVKMWQVYADWSEGMKIILRESGSV